MATKTYIIVGKIEPDAHAVAHKVAGLYEGGDWHWSIEQEQRDASGKVMESVHVADGDADSEGQAEAALNAALPTETVDGRKRAYRWTDPRNVVEIVDAG